MSARSVAPRLVFVLDVSGSMSGVKCQTLQLSVVRYIEDIPEGYYVGIVLFNHFVWTEHELIQITDRSVRDGLIGKVPQLADGGTDIGSSLMEGLAALRRTGLPTEGATIVLATDGEDARSKYKGEYVDKVAPDLVLAKVKVNCIAVGDSADSHLERLAKATNGNTYVTSSTNREMAARVMEAAIREVMTSKEMVEAVTISVCNELIAITSQSNNEFQVVIDSDIGRNSVFTISSESIDKFSVSVISPKAQIYDSTSEELTKDLSLKRYQLKPKTTDSGVWRIKFITHSNQTISANVLVLSQPMKPNAIEMIVTLIEADSNNPPIIVTQLVKGSDAVIGAEVTATVDKPNGTESKVKLLNFNNIYCNYFSDYCGSGRYGVTVLAKSDANNCRLKSITETTNRFSGQIVEEFQRQQIIGEFQIQELMPSKPSTNEKLQELASSLTFNCRPLNSGAIETPVPMTAKAKIKPRIKKPVPISDVMKAQKDKLLDSYLSVKKLINSSKLSEDEKKALKETVEEINAFITSNAMTTTDEINGYVDKLVEIENKIN